MVLVSQTELSNGQMHPAICVGLQAFPLHQEVESRHSESQPSLEVSPGTVSHMLDVADGLQHGKHRLDHHAGVPLTSLAYQQVGGIALLEREQLVGEHDHLLLVLGNHWVEGGVVNISSSEIPTYNQAPLVEQHAKLAAHYPLVIGKAFTPHLVGASLVPPRVQELYPVGICHSQQGRLSHEAGRPILVISE